MRSLILLALVVTTSGLCAAEPVQFDSRDSAETPERFRLASHTFTAESEPWLDLEQSRIEVRKVRFPSAVASKYPVNDTVHGEYFIPKGMHGKRPAVLVLDILDGSARVSRGEALWLAQHGIPAFVMYLPYYGPRQPVNERVRMLMPDVEHSTAAVRQAVLDSRRAIAWLAQQPGVDAAKVGVVGTSLGSFMAGLTAAAEPRLESACLLLTGGGLVDALQDHPQAKQIANAVRLLGITPEGVRKIVDPLDPLTYAKQMSGRRLLFVVATRDDVVPPSAGERLWKATGQQKIVRVNATHVGAVLYTAQGMNAIVEHITEAK
jgi:dienelactone hydrolase